MDILENYYLTAKGKAEMQRLATIAHPEISEILLALDNRTECEGEVDPYTLSKLLQQGYIGKIEKF